MILVELVCSSLFVVFYLCFVPCCRFAIFFYMIMIESCCTTIIKLMLILIMPSFVICIIVLSNCRLVSHSFYCSCYPALFYTLLQSSTLSFNHSTPKQFKFKQKLDTVVTLCFLVLFLFVFWFSACGLRVVVLICVTDFPLAS